MEKQQPSEAKPTAIWKCKDANCKAWVREEFAPKEYPECPICKGETIRSFKHLPSVVKKFKKPRVPKQEF